MICQIWLDVQRKSLGPAIEFEEEYKYYWMYIPHFIHSPFYVYAYAFGDSLVNALWHSYQKSDKDEFSQKYIEMLSAGGTKATSLSIRKDLKKRVDAAWKRYSKSSPFDVNRQQFLAAMLSHWEETSDQKHRRV